MYNRNTSKNESLPLDNDPKQHFIKKSHNIPNLGLHKIFKPESVKDPLVKKPSGFHSDRSQKSHKTEELHPKPRLSSDRKTQKEPVPSGINFYLYKNFNKFIQNLYVKNAEQNNKLKAKTHREHLGDNPYIKEIAAANSARKYLSNRGSHSPPNIRSNVAYAKHASNTEPDEIVDLGKEPCIGFSSASPKKRENNFLKMGDYNKKKPEQGDKGILYKSKSSRAPKASQQADFVKSGQSKAKLKQT